MPLSADERRLELQLRSLRMSKVTDTYEYGELQSAFNMIEAAMPDDFSYDIPSTPATRLLGSVMTMLDNHHLSRKAISEVIYHNVLGNL